MEISYHGMTASLALLLIFPVTMALFGSMKPARAATLIAFGAALYGPEGAYYKLPLFPHLTKETLPYLFMTLAALAFVSKKFLKRSPGLGPEMILYISMFSAVVTFTNNTDTLVYGSYVTRVIPGLNIKDAFAMGLEDVLKMAVPFMLGRTLFEDREDLRMFVRAFLGIMVVYTLWIAVELKMSPQMNVWVYGYFAHGDFAQTLRWGGYRPMVFTAHGLMLALVVCHACIMLAAAKRVGFEVHPHIKTGHLFWFMIIMLVLCKSTGAIIYALVLIPLILRAPVGVVSRVAQVLAVLAIVYPFLRSQDWVPVEAINEWATKLSAERAQSLMFRFENEGMLLERAQEKLWFGWGSYGRNYVFDPIMGKYAAVADGAWIIILGMRGVVGMLMELGVLSYAVVTSLSRLKKMPNEEDKWLFLGIACMLSLGLFDLIPNGLFNHYPFFVAGVLYGLSRGMTSPKALRAAREAAQRGMMGHGPGYVPMPPPVPVPIWSPPVSGPADQDRLFDADGAPTRLPEDELFEDETPTEGQPPADEAETIGPDQGLRSPYRRPVDEDD